MQKDNSVLPFYGATISDNIQALIEERNAVYKSIKKTPNFDLEDDSNVVPYIELDMLSFEIIDSLIKQYRYLQPDFALECLTHLGHAPTLANDDNGMWAVSGECYQPVVYGKMRIEGAVTVMYHKKQWFKTIRLAVFNYLLSCRR